MALDYHYYNLHKQCWSVMNRGRVVDHVTQRYIYRPVFVVRPAGQRKVRETRRKNVHAFVKGEGYGLLGAVGLVSSKDFDFAGASDWVEVSYNPYRTWRDEDTGEQITAPFYVKSTGDPVHEAKEAVLTSDRKLFVRF